jgi:hypothetical protein
MLPELCAITATYNRHEHLERSVRYFLDQDYEGKHTLLIYNNNPQPLVLDDIELPANKKILLFNRHLDRLFFQPYTNLGTIYTDILHYVPSTADVFTFQDDDDTFLPNHYRKGIEGYLKARRDGKLAYKPQKSYYRDPQWNVSLVENTMEPSIFVEAFHVRVYRFHHNTTDQHHRWLAPLTERNQIVVDPDGTPTMIYNWMGDVFKTSGNPTHPQNFENCRNHKGDLGDGIITPASWEAVEPYYQHQCTQK